MVDTPEGADTPLVPDPLPADDALYEEIRAHRADAQPAAET
jgi:hypothetical protein